MPIELKILAWSAVLLLFYIIAATRSATAQYGTKWNMGPRDEAVPAPSQIQPPSAVVELVLPATTTPRSAMIAIG